MQPFPITQLPARSHGRLAQHLAMQRFAALQVRHDVLVAQAQQLAIERQPGAAIGRVAVVVIGHRGLEGADIIRRRNRLAGELGEILEFVLAALAYRFTELVVVRGEELEGLLAAPFFAHEQQRDHRAEQQQGGGAFQRVVIGQAAQALTDCSVTNLVVVLQEQHEGARRQVAAAAAAGGTMAGGFTLIDEAFTQAAGELAGGIRGEVGVVAFVFAGEQVMQHVVAVVVPLGDEALLQQFGIVVLVLQHQMQMARGGDRGVQALGHFDKEIALADGVHGIETQAVDAIVLHPHQGVVDEIVTHFAAAKIDGRAPGCVYVLAEEVAGVLAQVIAIGAEVVVHHVDEHHQAQLVGTVDQATQLVWRAVGGVGCVRQHAVVAPVAATGKLAQRHQLDGGDTQLGQRRQLLCDCRVAAQRADMHLIEHCLLPRAALPLIAAPVVGLWVDDAAGAVHIVGLPA